MDSILTVVNTDISTNITLTHVADTLIQRDLQSIQGIHFNQFGYLLGLGPLTLMLLGEHFTIEQQASKPRKGSRTWFIKKTQGGQIRLKGSL